MAKSEISSATLKRLPIYLKYLQSMPENGNDNISATAIASGLGYGDVQVRKDLASVCGMGKPKIGYVKRELIDSLRMFLGYNDTNDAVIVGAGKLGKALLEYKGFRDYGLNILAAFDIDESVQCKTETGKCIFPLDRFDELCQRLKIRIGIITVPAECAQQVCDMMVRNGIKAIWNFAPVNLEVDDDVIVQNENMAVSLAVLSGRLYQRMIHD